MKKAVAAEILIVAVTLALVLPFAFAHGGQFMGVQRLSADNQQTFLSFDLIPGQNVTGYYASPDYLSEFFQVLRPNSSPMITSPTTYYHAQNRSYFSFIADSWGRFCVDYDGYIYPGVSYDLEYSYTISEPTVFGLATTVWVETVISIGVVLTLINAYLYRRNAKNNSSQPE
jgi:hypothetical protein